MANTTATVQKEFATSSRMALENLKGGVLRKLGEYGAVSGGESYTFYRDFGGTTGDGDNPPTMLGSDASQGGDYKSFVAPISKIWTQDKITDTQLKKTGLDIKSGTVKRMTNNLMVKEDDKIVKTILASTELTSLGSATLDLTALDTAKLILEEIADALVSATMTPDGVKGTSIIMNRRDYKKLRRNDAFVHGDYKDAFTGGGNTELPLSLNGAEILITETIASGTILIIPSNTFGFAEWENSKEATADYFATDGQRWHLQIVGSVGVVVIEPAFITKITVKPSAETKKAMKPAVTP